MRVVPAGDADSSPVPELPVSADPPATAVSEAAFEHAVKFADQRIKAATQDLQDAWKRVMALGRRAQQNPDGTLDLPRVFDKQLFEYSEIAKLTLAHPVQQSGPQLQQSVAVIQTAAKQLEGAMLTDFPQMSRLAQERLKTLEGMYANCPPGSDACYAPYLARIRDLDRQIEEITYRDCKLTKSTADTQYSQMYKVWKQFSDSLRDSSRDFYAYSQPIIDQVWAPALNDLLQAHRELAVLTLYKGEADGARALAGMAKGIQKLKCVPPAPPATPKSAKDTNLKKQKPDCPLKPPLKLGLVVLDMELGCDKVELSGGEVLRFKFERNFAKKETAYWVGVGASASLPKIDLGGGNGLGDNGNSWSPPGSTIGASVTGEVMIGLHINDAGDVQDIGIQSTVAASGSAAGVSGAIGLTGTASLENGANVDPILAGGASLPNIDLPGGMGWTP